MPKQPNDESSVIGAETTAAQILEMMSPKTEPISSSHGGNIKKIHQDIMNQDANAFMVGADGIPIDHRTKGAMSRGVEPVELTGGPDWMQGLLETSEKIKEETPEGDMGDLSRDPESEGEQRARELLALSMAPPIATGGGAREEALFENAYGEEPIMPSDNSEVFEGSSAVNDRKEDDFFDKMTIKCLDCEHCWHMTQYANVGHKSEDNKYYLDEEAFCTLLPNFILPVSTRLVKECTKFSHAKLTKRARVFSFKWFVKKTVAIAEIVLKVLGDKDDRR